MFLLFAFWTFCSFYIIFLLVAHHFTLYQHQEMSQSQPVWIYHELQDSLLCGQHALNNLIQQQNFFHPGQLADIAHQLDAQERQFMGGSLSEPSGNVDAQGNFSIQVITNALSNIGIELSVWNMKKADVDPSLEVGFVVNRDAHWFSIRKINNKWWDLNSAKETPEYISEFYLGAFLTQLSSDGYSVFVARGNFPQHSMDNDNNQGPFWHLESTLTKSNSSIAVEKFAGKGNKLGASSGEVSMQESSEEEELARAIALSVADMTSTAGTDSDSGSAPVMTEKEKIRAKRLAAMGR
jgi:Ataxin-3